MPLARLEAALRTAALRGATTWADRGRAAAPPDLTRGAHRVLMLRDDGLGDLIVSLAVLRAIAARPGITLDILCSPGNAPLARRARLFGTVLEHRRAGITRARESWQQLRAGEYDVVVDGRVAIPSINTQTAGLLLASGAPWRVGIAGRRNDFLYTVPVTPRPWAHWVDAIAALAEPFGIDPAAHDWTPWLTLHDAERAQGERRWQAVGDGPRILVNLSVGHPSRRWPDTRFAAVLARLRAARATATIAVLAMPDDAASARDLAASVGGAAWTLDLVQTIAATATAQLVITPDTAVSHMASAFRTPTLTLLRQGYERWVPYRTPGRNVFGADPRRLDGLGVEPVLSALDALLDEGIAAPR
jgi:ADP-heptose:LPS heptosyltransferase